MRLVSFSLALSKVTLKQERVFTWCAHILDHFEYFLSENSGQGSMPRKIFKIAYIGNLSKAF